MKRFSLLSLVALVFAVVVYACSESTTPPNSSSLMAPKDPSRNAFGDPPPPPVETAVVVCTDVGCVVVDGSYMANSAVASNGRRATFATFAANPAGDGVCTLPGTAWLRFSKNAVPQPQGFEVTTSANGRIKCSHLRASGNGTIEFGGVVVHLDQVLTFNNTGDCTAICGDFTATTDPPGGAHGTIVNRQYFNYANCYIISEGGGVYCPGPGEGL